MTPIKREIRRRPSYFRGQLLDETDFLAEQKYHVDAWRRHHAWFHSWGVIDGLTVTVDKGRAVVAPGVAIDSLGREVQIDEATALDLTGFSRGEAIYIVLAYEEEGGDPHLSEHGEAHTSRVIEYSVLSASETAGAGGAVTLARVTLQAKHGDVVSYANTQYASSLVGPHRIGYRELQPGLRRGWVRLPFKPFPLEEAKAFRIGPTEARSTEQGASGSMAIPVPPGATRALRFRIAGEINDGAIKVDFYRCGWDFGKDAPEVHHGDVDREDRTNMLTFEYDPKTSTATRGEYEPSSKKPGAYRFTAPLGRDLDPEYHSLSMVITVTKRTSISLVAVEFGYPGEESRD
jgi:hypothetical protein